MKITANILTADEASGLFRNINLNRLSQPMKMIFVDIMKSACPVKTAKEIIETCVRVEKTLHDAPWAGDNDFPMFATRITSRFGKEDWNKIRDRVVHYLRKEIATANAHARSTSASSRKTGTRVTRARRAAR